MELPEPLLWDILLILRPVPDNSAAIIQKLKCEKMYHIIWHDVASMMDM